MAKRRAKIFEAGNYSQGEYPIEKVKNIFDNSDVATGIFHHTSKGGNLEMGKIDNFEVTNEGEVFADIDLNEKGDGALELGLIDGISVEIADEKVTNVAFLPVGIKPAVETAHFEENGKLILGGTIEFQEVEKLTSDDATKLTLLDLGNDEDMKVFESFRETVWDLSDSKYAVDTLKNKGYTVMKTAEFQEYEKVESKKTFTEEEIREKMKEEFEIKSEAKEFYKQLEDKGIITKALKDEGVTLEFMEVICNESKKENIVEFAEAKVPVGKTILALLNSLKGLNTESALKAKEFEKIEDNKKQKKQQEKWLEIAKTVSDKKNK